VCIFCDRAGHLDEFYFRRKRIKKRRFEYARNSYRGEFLDFTPRSYYRASPRTYSRALPQFSHRPNHHLYSFGSRENRFVAKRFGYGTRPHRGDHFSCRSVFPTRGFYTHFEPRHLDSPRFLHHGSCSTWPSGEVQRTVKTSFGRMVKCWISKIYLTNPNTESSTFSHPM
jgi:hypothetical protein